MKPLSARAAELVAAIERTDAALGVRDAAQAPDARTRVFAAIDELAALGEVAAVPRLLPFVVGRRGEWREAAGDAVTRLVASASPLQLARIEEQCRRRWPYDEAPRWMAAFADARAARGVGDELLGLASFQPNGYGREASVAELNLRAGVRALPFLLLRCADWVPQVRERAVAAVRRRLRPVWADDLVRMLPVAERIRLGSRHRTAPVADEIEALLAARECRGALARGVASGDRAVRQASFRLAAAHAKEDAELAALVEQILRGDDVALRLQAARAARARLGADALRPLLPLLWRDRFAPVRAEALWAAADRLPEEAEQWVRRALVDANRAVREAARFVARKREPSLDLAAYYAHWLEALADPGLLAGALAGLGEVGRPENAPLAAAFVGHPSPHVSRAAFGALSRLSADEFVTAFAAALADGRPSVSRAGREALERRAAALGGAALWHTFATASLEHVRRNTLALFERVGRWSGAALLARAYAVGDGACRAAVASRLRRWLDRANRTFVPPSAGELRELRDAVDRAAAVPGLDDLATLGELRALIEYWERRR